MPLEDGPYFGNTCPYLRCVIGKRSRNKTYIQIPRDAEETPPAQDRHGGCLSYTLNRLPPTNSRQIEFIGSIVESTGMK